MKRSNVRERNPGTPLAKKICALLNKKRTVPKIMSVALIEPLVEMTATLNAVVSINSTTVMQTYWTASWILAFENFSTGDDNGFYIAGKSAAFKRSCLAFTAEKTGVNHPLFVGIYEGQIGVITWLEKTFVEM